MKYYIIFINQYTDNILSIITLYITYVNFIIINAKSIMNSIFFFKVFP